MIHGEKFPESFLKRTGLGRFYFPLLTFLHHVVGVTLRYKKRDACSFEFLTAPKAKRVAPTHCGLLSHLRRGTREASAATLRQTRVYLNTRSGPGAAVFISKPFESLSGLLEIFIAVALRRCMDCSQYLSLPLLVTVLVITIISVTLNRCPVPLFPSYRRMCFVILCVLLRYFRAWFFWRTCFVQMQSQDSMLHISNTLCGCKHTRRVYKIPPNISSRVAQETTFTVPAVGYSK